MAEKLKLGTINKLPNEVIDRTLTSTTIEPTQEEQVITAPEGYNGFNEVKVKGARLQQKIVTPSKETQVIKADDGYYGLSDVIVSATPFNNDDVIEEIDSVKEMLTDGANATAEDIKLGKTAYVGGELITGTYVLSGTIDITENGTYDVSDYASANINVESTFKKIIDHAKSMSYMFSENTNNTDFRGLIQYSDTENATSMYRAFYNNFNLKYIPPMNTSNVTNFADAFRSDYSIETIALLDCRNASSFFNTFYGCNGLKNLTMLNIKVNLQVGSGSSYGRLLTLESLIGLCQQCVNVNTSRTLTVGTANLEKLANVYVKLTNEPEEDETLPKIPMVQCESTDEGAMLISEYMKLKNWTLA